MEKVWRVVELVLIIIWVCSVLTLIWVVIEEKTKRQIEEMEYWHDREVG